MVSVLIYTNIRGLVSCETFDYPLLDKVQKNLDKFPLSYNLTKKWKYACDLNISDVLHILDLFEKPFVKSAQVIQKKWRRVIADPNCKACKNRLMWEASQLIVLYLGSEHYKKRRGRSHHAARSKLVFYLDGGRHEFGKM